MSATGLKKKGRFVGSAPLLNPFFAFGSQGQAEQEADCNVLDCPEPEMKDETPDSERPGWGRGLYPPLRLGPVACEWNDWSAGT